MAALPGILQQVSVESDVSCSASSAVRCISDSVRREHGREAIRDIKFALGS